MLLNVTGTQTETAEGHIHTLWPMVSFAGDIPIPGCFICRECFYMHPVNRRRGVTPDLHDIVEGFSFTTDVGDVVFRHPDHPLPPSTN